MQLPGTAPPVKKQLWKIRRFSRVANLKIIFPLRLPEQSGGNSKSSFPAQRVAAWGRSDAFCKRHRRRGRSAGPEGERGVSTPPSLPLDTPLPATRKGLLAPFRPQRGRLQPKILKIHAIRREDLFTVFSASADLKGPSVAARQLPAGERVQGTLSVKPLRVCQLFPFLALPSSPDRGKSFPRGELLPRRATYPHHPKARPSGELARRQP